jgi:hypothetical protein
MASGQLVKTRKLIDAAAEALTAERPMTVRQLFYRLVSTKALENTRADYVKLSRVLTRAREDGEIDFADIVDRSRPEYEPNVWKDLPGYLRAVGRDFRRDLWRDQPWHVEVWVEKDAIIGSIEDLAVVELGVTVRVGRGFMSATRCHEIAELFTSTDKPKCVFYLGDHDPSGRCIESELYERVIRYSENTLERCCDDYSEEVDNEWCFKMIRLAIHESDIKLYNLPPLRVKVTDSRSKTFKRQYGSQCVELDALPPTELRRRIKDAVEELIDWDVWNRAIAVEKVEKASIERLVNRISMGRNGENPEAF